MSGGERCVEEMMSVRNILYVPEINACVYRIFILEWMGVYRSLVSFKIKNGVNVHN